MFDHSYCQNIHSQSQNRYFKEFAQFLYVFVGPIIPRAKHLSNWSLSDLFPPTASQYLRDQGCLAKYTNVSIKSKYANTHLECKSSVSIFAFVPWFWKSLPPWHLFANKNNKNTHNMSHSRIWKFLCYHHLLFAWCHRYAFWNIHSHKFQMLSVLSWTFRFCQSVNVYSPIYRTR